MTATEILRRLLDERGVEWGNIRNDGSESDYLTEWQFENNQGRAIAIEWAVGSGLSVEIHRYHLTPEQAIAATLGSSNCTNDERTNGTCKLDDFADVPFSVDYEIEGYDMDSGKDYATLAECSACGAYIIVPPEYHHVLTCDGDEVYQPYRYCPNCGAKVVGSTTNDVDAEVEQ